MDTLGDIKLEQECLSEYYSSLLNVKFLTVSPKIKNKQTYHSYSHITHTNIIKA